MPGEISVVLSGFRRLHNLPEQLSAVRAQTVPASEVLFWMNDPEATVSQETATSTTLIRVARANVNFGVWARFAFALNCRSEYVCVFDDDTIPGPRWFENCLATMAQQEGLLGTIGVLYPRPAESYYDPMIKVGWYDSGNRDQATRVDFVGHAWFFKRSWLSTFWRELPPPETVLCGEDMHFSFMLQKYLGISTAVPPHPADDKSLWGSVKGELGMDEHSLWNRDPKTQTGSFRGDMDDFFKNQRARGWRLVCER
jgi:hypothetical protein